VLNGFFIFGRTLEGSKSSNLTDRPSRYKRIDHVVLCNDRPSFLAWSVLCWRDNIISYRLQLHCKQPAAGLPDDCALTRDNNEKYMIMALRAYQQPQPLLSPGTGASFFFTVITITFIVYIRRPRLPPPQLIVITASSLLSSAN
jgi:hypothetical protein